MAVGDRQNGVTRCVAYISHYVTFAGIYRVQSQEKPTDSDWAYRVHS